jgi:hypothetical protein
MGVPPTPYPPTEVVWVVHLVGGMRSFVVRTVTARVGTAQRQEENEMSDNVVTMPGIVTMRMCVEMDRSEGQSTWGLTEQCLNDPVLPSLTHALSPLIETCSGHARRWSLRCKTRAPSLASWLGRRCGGPPRAAND